MAYRFRKMPTGGQLSARDHKWTLSNEGATAIAPFVLPAAVPGLQFTFVVQDTDGIRVTVGQSDDTIKGTDDVSAAGGKIESTGAGSSITILALNATEWIYTAVVGTWTST